MMEDPGVLGLALSADREVRSGSVTELIDEIGIDYSHRAQPTTDSVLRVISVSMEHESWRRFHEAIYEATEEMLSAEDGIVDWMAVFEDSRYVGQAELLVEVLTEGRAPSIDLASPLQETLLDLLVCSALLSLDASASWLTFRIPWTTYVDHVEEPLSPLNIIPGATPRVMMGASPSLLIPRSDG